MPRMLIATNWRTTASKTFSVIRIRFFAELNDFTDMLDAAIIIRINDEKTRLSSVRSFHFTKALSC